MNTTEVISTAFVMGAVGSLHCIGMCGPLGLSLPVAHRTNSGRLFGGTLYNLGRVTTYSVLGLTLGLAGQTLFSTRWQSVLSTTLGIIIFLYLLIPSKYKASSFFVSRANRPFLKLRAILGRLFHSPTYTSLFSIGVLNGLLPCGMIYLALSTSLLAGTAAKGSLFMLFFGLGTFPAMLGVVFFGSYFNQQIRAQLRKAIPVFLFIMATLLVLRGLNLGIPFISPQLPVSSHEPVTCH
jgi:uncharacterized protein